MQGSSARDLLGLLARLGITHLVGLPDNTSAPLFSLLAGSSGVAAPGPQPETDRSSAASDLASRADTDAPWAAIRLLTVTREGEAIALASGLWLGGASPAVVLQNTGLLEAGDALRGTASRMGAPLLLLVTCRGYQQARARGLEPGRTEVERDMLVRPDLDSVAPMTERTLSAWGIPFQRWEEVRDLKPIESAWALAQQEERPVAVLVETELP